MASITPAQAAKLRHKGKCTCGAKCFSYTGVHTNKKCSCYIHTAHKRNKSGFHSKPVLYDGIWFASMAEVRRYKELKEKLLFGEITDLKYEPCKYKIYIPKEWSADGEDHYITRYTPDFEYVVVKDQRKVTEDVKSKRRDKHGKYHGTSQARDWPLRKKLMKAIHGVDVVEIYMDYTE